MMGWRILEKDGRRMRFAAIRRGRAVWVAHHGVAAVVEPQSAFASEAGSDDRILAPMTGRVVKVAVSAGDSVAKDQVLVVMEAMKMEYRLTAPHDGVVEEVSCSEGALVDVGATLVTFES